MIAEVIVQKLISYEQLQITASLEDIYFLWDCITTSNRNRKKANEQQKGG